MKLFATDLDGTLVARDQTIHPRDRAAIAAARKRGVLVTIATGRLTERTHPIAHALGLQSPLVCADGSVVLCGATARVLRRHTLQAEMVDSALAALAQEELASFIFTDAGIHGCPRGERHHGYLRGWCSRISTHRALGAHIPDAIALLGIGPAARVARARERLAESESVGEVSSFEAAGGRVLRVIPRGVSKGAALAELAAELGIAADSVAVAGDYWNDLSMFAFAGRSFAMPHAPPEVRAAATHPLDHDVVRYGAFADALEAWIEES
jgi:Cof subfamily protein (haloacid dehalogenase superfamily)